MNDKQVINLACFIAWSEQSGGLRSKSPQQLLIAYQNIAQNLADSRGKLDLGALDEVTLWVKQWLPDYAPEGGKAEEFTADMPQGRPDDQPSE